jgi:hypothetical protein
VTNAPGVVREAIIKGRYGRGKDWAAKNFDALIADHMEEFPDIACCAPGTLNVLLEDPPDYAPPCDNKWKALARKRGASSGKYTAGHHISPLAKVVEINGVPLVAWIYRGGHEVGGEDHALELMARERISERLGLTPGAGVTLRIQEFAKPQPGMPQPPPPSKEVKEYLQKDYEMLAGMIRHQHDRVRNHTTVFMAALSGLLGIMAWVRGSGNLPLCDEWLALLLVSALGALASVAWLMVLCRVLNALLPTPLP